MATTAGAVVLLYYVVRRRHWSAANEDASGGGGREYSKSLSSSGKRNIVRMRPAQAPATWLETITTLLETLRFMYSETLGKWPIADLAFGINYLIRRQGHLQVASVYGGENCVQLIGSDIMAELKLYLRLVTLCFLFSKKPFPVFLESACYSEEDVLLQKPKAGLLKPAFTILRDKWSECFLLLIRGTHSIKDTLTAATGAVVPFHHLVVHDGGISNLVLGYAHCGMVAAARWIAKLSSPCLLKALNQYPHYKVQVVGHSLGGGTAALLTYILREHKEFSSSTCITFAPAACMTWELAESGKDFITTIINNSDLVPTFSAHSVDDLRSEVTASSWLNDLRDQVEHTSVLNVVYRSATAIGSRLPSIASAKATVSDAGALLRPVSSSTQVVMKRAQNVAQAVVKTRSSLSSWTCIGARRRTVGFQSNTNPDGDDMRSTTLITERKSETIATETVTGHPIFDKVDSCSSSGESVHDDMDVEEEQVQIDRIDPISCTDSLTGGDLWKELEKELNSDEEAHTRVHAEEEEAAKKQIIEEQKVLIEAVESKQPISSVDISKSHQFYPPGRIMHIVSTPSLETTDLGDDRLLEESIGIYETPRDLYSKLRLSKTMINDHYMPMYKKMIERLITEMEKDQACNC